MSQSVLTKLAGAPPQFLRQQQQQQQTFVPHRSGTCDERLSQLIGDIFIGNEVK